MTLPDPIATLAPMDVAGRLDRLRPALAGASVDALLVTSLTNIRYLTGFTGSAAMLLVTPSTALLTSDGRYRTQAEEQLAAAGVTAEVAIGSPGEQRKAVAGGAGAGGRVGLEAAAVTWAGAEEIKEVLSGRDVVATTGVVEALRRRKDAGELARMEAAAAVADAALTEVVGMLADGPTEEEFALSLEVVMRRGGASGPAFETIVAAGPNGALPHHRAGARPIGPGELIVVDFGATVDGYRSDMTRTFCVGEPDETAARMFSVVAEAQRAGVDAVAEAVEAKAVDRACREVIAEAGWGDAFVHSTGHGVGLDIHEAPAVSATSTDTLDSEAVVTVEPGVYLPGRGGVRIEDTVVVTAGGCRALTAYPKTLTVG